MSLVPVSEMVLIWPLVFDGRFRLNANWSLNEESTTTAPNGPDVPVEFSVVELTPVRMLAAVAGVDPRLSAVAPAMMSIALRIVSSKHATRLSELLTLY
jgi:hypothetical protein